jgi:hypothetical protein
MLIVGPVHSNGWFFNALPRALNATNYAAGVRYAPAPQRLQQRTRSARGAVPERTIRVNSRRPP